MNTDQIHELLYPEAAVVVAEKCEDRPHTTVEDYVDGYQYLRGRGFSVLLRQAVWSKSDRDIRPYGLLVGQISGWLMGTEIGIFVTREDTLTFSGNGKTIVCQDCDGRTVCTLGLTILTRLLGGGWMTLTRPNGELVCQFYVSSFRRGITVPDVVAIRLWNGTVVTAVFRPHNMEDWGFPPTQEPRSLFADRPVVDSPPCLNSAPLSAAGLSRREIQCLLALLLWSHSFVGLIC